MERHYDIPLSVPCLEENARRYVLECFETNYVSSVGPFVEQFERAFAAWLGARHAVACASGTAALHLAMRVLGVERGDEVFVPTFSFAASINAAVYQGATPILIDSEPRTWNMDPEVVVAEIESRARAGRAQPKAVEVVHILGCPAELAPILEVCARYGIPVLEDAAEALGAGYSSGPLAGRNVGTIGRVGCFSFNGNKVMTTGNGGMLVTEDQALAERARHLSRQAKLPGSDYDHDEVGYNYRLSNLAAALGLAQLESLPKFLDAKRRIAARYDSAFRSHADVVLPPHPAWASPSFWLYSILVGDAANGRAALVRDALGRRRIEARPLWRPAHKTRAFRGLSCIGGAVADRLFREGLSLPSSVSLTEVEQTRVIEAVLEATRGGQP